MPKRRPVVYDLTVDTKNKKILNFHINRIRHLLHSLSTKTGRTIVELLSQTLTKHEVGQLVQHMLDKVPSDNSTSRILPPPEAEAEVKQEHQDEVEEAQANRVFYILTFDLVALVKIRTPNFLLFLIILFKFPRKISGNC